jgi:hypothetical protein
MLTLPCEMPTSRDWLGSTTKATTAEKLMEMVAAILYGKLRECKQNVCLHVRVSQIGDRIGNNTYGKMVIAIRGENVETGIRYITNGPCVPRALTTRSSKSQGEGM